jgi:hypothetical protein
MYKKDDIISKLVDVFGEAGTADELHVRYLSQHSGKAIDEFPRRKLPATLCPKTCRSSRVTLQAKMPSGSAYTAVSVLPRPVQTSWLVRACFDLCFALLCFALFFLLLSLESH